MHNTYLSKTAAANGDSASMLRKRMANTFLTVGGMLGITAATAYVSAELQLGLIAHLTLFALTIALMFALSKFRNSPAGLVVLAVFSAVFGVMLSHTLKTYLEMPGGTTNVATAFGLTVVATAGCAFYCLTTRRDFSFLRPMLLVGTLVLLAAALLNIFLGLSTLSLTISVVGVLIFTARLLHDISRLVLNEGENYYMAAMSIYLDMINLFLHLLRLISSSRN